MFTTIDELGCVLYIAAEMRYEPADYAGTGRRPGG